MKALEYGDAVVAFMVRWFRALGLPFCSEAWFGKTTNRKNRRSDACEVLSRASALLLVGAVGACDTSTPAATNQTGSDDPEVGDAGSDVGASSGGNANGTSGSDGQTSGTGGGSSMKLPNGGECTASDDCLSENCAQSVGGDLFCYGSVENGGACAVTQDCAAGICQRGKCAAPGTCQSNAECAVNAICNQAGSCQQVCGENAYATEEMSCDCLPGFEWASSDPSVTDCVQPSTLPGCHLFARDAGGKYLGEHGTCFGVSSVCNEFGKYGSPYGSDSIFNEFGTYGSPYGSFSAFNDLSTSPPVIVCDGAVSACVTTNELACPGTDLVHPLSLCTCQ